MKATKTQRPFWIEIDEDYFVMVNGAWRVHYLRDDEEPEYFLESASGSFRLDAKGAKSVLAKLGLTP